MVERFKYSIYTRARSAAGPIGRSAVSQWRRRKLGPRMSRHWPSQGLGLEPQGRAGKRCRPSSHVVARGRSLVTQCQVSVTCEQERGDRETRKCPVPDGGDVSTGWPPCPVALSASLDGTRCPACSASPPPWPQQKTTGT